VGHASERAKNEASQVKSEKIAAAQQWYERGNEYRKQQLWHEAINCYIQAIALDPDSPAVEAKKILDDIMAFYCKDMYNP
jgi:tetratricopeptide (TPR) repeat protein